MRRYVYCPSDDHIASAEELAIKTGLPILIGDSEGSVDVDFNRHTVSVIKIPERKELSMLYEDVPVGFHQSIRYVNEYKTLKNNTKLFINNVFYVSFLFWFPSVYYSYINSVEMSY